MITIVEPAASSIKKPPPSLFFFPRIGSARMLIDQAFPSLRVTCKPPETRGDLTPKILKNQLRGQQREMKSKFPKQKTPIMPPWKTTESNTKPPTETITCIHSRRNLCYLLESHKCFSFLSLFLFFFPCFNLCSIIGSNFFPLLNNIFQCGYKICFYRTMARPRYLQENDRYSPLLLTSEFVV